MATPGSISIVVAFNGSKRHSLRLKPRRLSVDKSITRVNVKSAELTSYPLLWARFRLIRDKSVFSSRGDRVHVAVGWGKPEHWHL